jgi:uncharacterized membrane protein
MSLSIIAAVILLLLGLVTILYAALSFGMAEATGLPRVRRAARTTRLIGFAFVAAALVIGGVDLLT